MSATSSRRRVEVFCLTYGEPSQNRFGPQFEYSLSILNRLTRRVAPIPKFVTPLLAARRARLRVANFTEKQWNSPLEEISRKQVASLQDALSRLSPDIDWNVTLVFEFRPPYIWTHLENLKSNPPDDIIILPLYVAESDFTTGVSRTDLARFHSKNKNHRLPSVRYVEGFGFDRDLGRVLANFIWRHCLQHGWNEDKTRDAVLIMGAHGTLVYPPAGINSGWKETCHLYGLIRGHLREKFASVRIGWLNHTIGGKWTFPEVRESAKESQDFGIRSVVYFPFGFMADNGESILEGRQHLGEFEWKDMLYLPCPNDNTEFINYLSAKVIQRLEQPPEDWSTIDHKNEKLVRKELPAVRAKSGPFKFSSQALAILAAVFWILIGGWLTIRGFNYTQLVESKWAWSAAIIFGIAVGYWKGTRILGRLATKNIARLRTLPQPSPIYRMFSKSTWMIILFFSAVGMVIRFSPLSDFVRGAVLNAVGLAMLVGACYYLANLRRARPSKVLEMP